MTLHSSTVLHLAPESRAITPTPRLPVWARVLLVMVLFLPTSAAGLLLLLIPGFGAALERDDDSAVLAYAPYALLVLAAYVLVSWLLVRGVDRRRLRDLGLRVDGRAVLALILGYAIAQVLALVAGFGARALGVEPGVAESSLLADATAGSALVAAVFVLLRSFVLQGIGEEVLFRGYLMQSLRKRPVLAVLLTAVAFAIPHLASSGGQDGALERVLYLVMPFGFALSAGFLAVALRSVWAAIGIHGGFHVALAVTMLVGLPLPGPGAYVALGILHAVAALVIMRCIPRRRWDEVRVLGPYGRP